MKGARSRYNDLIPTNFLSFHYALEALQDRKQELLMTIIPIRSPSDQQILILLLRVRNLVRKLSFDLPWARNNPQRSKYCYHTRQYTTIPEELDIERAGSML